MRRLGICIAGLNGAVASTIVAGTFLIRQGNAPSQGFLSEPWSDRLDLAGLDRFVFGGWDVRGENLLEAAIRHAVLDPRQLQTVAKPLARVLPWKAPHRCSAADHLRIVKDIETFRKRNQVETVIVINLLPTGQPAASKMYARAAAKARCAFINFTPNDCGERALSGIPYCGRDGKTGQTWLKSVLAPALRARALRVTGWYSTNLLGNADGRVVSDPTQGKTKIESKSRLLGDILGYEPHHIVQINFYPPRGDNKESWDAIDIVGWLGYEMSIKIDFLCRDSILAAPLLLDLALFMDLAKRSGLSGPQEWLSFYFKSPMCASGHQPEHELSVQLAHLRTELRRLVGDPVKTRAQARLG
jgi:myo-inositol-1-phosphate synthase